jgi:predicted lysophospholipase L1 biosynthesis ABC-type transport system permease subunit
MTRVVIIGGGIGGATAGCALAQAGLEVSVYEAAPELKEIGAGVALASQRDARAEDDRGGGRGAPSRGSLRVVHDTQLAHGPGDLEDQPRPAGRNVRAQWRDGSPRRPARRDRRSALGASLTTATDAERETNRWLGPLAVVIIFAFTSIAVINALTMIALQRGRELGLLRLVGATRRQVRSMARWEAGLIITIGLGLGLALAAAALLPLSHALTGGLRPYVPFGQLAAILGVSALLALLALALPTRPALRSRPIDAIGVGE